eukprot:753301-Hanusia_phi.AAC.1
MVDHLSARARYSHQSYPDPCMLPSDSKVWTITDQQTWMTRFTALGSRTPRKTSKRGELVVLVCKQTSAETPSAHGKSFRSLPGGYKPTSEARQETTPHAGGMPNTLELSCDNEVVKRYKRSDSKK